MNPNQSEWRPYKPKEYRLYLIWKALPLALKSGTIEPGIDWFDENDLTELNGILTQAQFASRFGLHPSTLTEWNQKEVPSEYEILDWKYWAHDLTKDVVFALYEAILKYGDAARVRVWFQYITPEALDNKDNRDDATEQVFATMREIVESLKDYPQQDDA